MTNQQRIVEGLGGLLACADPEQVPAEILKTFRCPNTWAYGCRYEWPTEEDCLQCKRQWLAEKATEEGGRK